jgi:uncharacterized membrane protein/PKD repeat protein/protein-disulfide isomerase
MKMRVFAVALLAALAAGAVYSHNLTRLVNAESHADLACSASAVFDCAKNLTSAYGKIFGISVSAFAAGFFVFLFVHTLLALRQSKMPMDQASAGERLFALPLFLGSAAGLAAVYYLAVSIFVLHSICLHCTVLYGLIALTICISYAGFHHKDAKKPGQPSILGVLASLRLKSASPALAFSLACACLSLAVLMPQKRALEAAFAIPRILDSAHPISITEFSDFECLACIMAGRELEKLKSEFPGKLTVKFVNYPLCHDCNPNIPGRLHPYACLAARIGIVMKARGKFDGYCNKVFAETAAADEHRLYAIVAELGEREQDIRKEVNAVQTVADLNKDIELGRKIGVRATPTLLVDGKISEGGLALAGIKATLQAGTGPVKGELAAAVTDVPYSAAPIKEQAAVRSVSVPWAGIIDPSRAIDWSNAGAGSIPDRTTIYATLNAGATVSQINNAIANCPSGQVVYLNPGTYSGLSDQILLKSNVTLRGAGADKTFLVWSGANGVCNGLGLTGICVSNGDTEYVNGPSNLASWTGGYSKGATSITLGAVSVGNINTLQVGSLLVLDQQDDASDTGNIFVCQTYGVNGSCSQQGGSGVAKTGRALSQQVTVTSISGTGPWTIGITPGLYAPNWNSSQSPEAWWSNNPPVSGVGLENLSADYSAVGPMATGIMFHNATQSWVKNIRSINGTALAGAATTHVLVWQSTHITVRDGYFYGSSPSSEGYGVDFASTSSDNLAENNIFQHMATATILENSIGNVFGYNYAVDNYYGGNWQQQDGFHHGAGDYFNLWEGHEGIGFNGDDIHGTSFMQTHFRDYLSGHDPATETGAKNQATFAYFPFAYSRYYNLVGSVLGSSNYHTNYQAAAISATDCGNPNVSSTVIVLGYSDQGGTAFSAACLGAGFDIPNDLLVASTLMRWGNYVACTGDPACNTVRFMNSEVPSAISPYGNPLPASQTLPASFYVSAKPAWWGTMPWPAVGPDITGGNIANVGGHAYHNPAANCYLNVMGGLTDGSSGALTFNADACYASGEVITSGPTATPNPATVGQAVNFSVAATGAAPLTYAWTFGDGVGTSSGASANYTYTAAGTYTATVVVTDVNGLMATGTVTVLVNNYSICATPAFNPAPGAYSGTQTVAITCATSGATICYTTDGSTPTVASTMYSAAISISSSTQLQAIAIETGLTNSPVISGVYNIADSSTYVPDTDNDTDGNGYPDEIKTALGVSLTNSSATPLNMPVGITPQALTLRKLSVKLNFAKTTGNDKIIVSGLLPITAGFVASFQTVVVDVGGVVKVFTLNSKGKGVAATGYPAVTSAANDHFALKFKAVKGKVNQQTGTFTAQFNRGTLARSFADVGLLGSASIKKVTRTVPVVILFNSQMYQAAQTVQYTATANKAGLAAYTGK